MQIADFHFRRFAQEGGLAPPLYKPAPAGLLLYEVVPGFLVKPGASHELVEELLLLGFFIGGLPCGESINQLCGAALPFTHYAVHFASPLLEYATGPQKEPEDENCGGCPAEGENDFGRQFTFHLSSPFPGGIGIFSW